MGPKGLQIGIEITNRSRDDKSVENNPMSCQCRDFAKLGKIAKRKDDKGIMIGANICQAHKRRMTVDNTKPGRPVSVFLERLETKCNHFPSYEDNSRVN